ncbi:MAG: hypothetical protein QOF43_1947 [Gaiellaceae bacterium]|nr:hypothetical protein [Gaiellaceae bacterium]
MAPMIDAATGVLLSGGQRLFPIAVSNPPPQGRKAPNGRNGFAELAAAGVNLIRTGRADWSPQHADQQIAAERALLDAAGEHGLAAWSWLGDLPNLPSAQGPQEQLLAKVADRLQGHPALGAYKGIDEPRNPFRGDNWIRPAGLVRAYRRLKQLDPSHPLVIIQAPLGTVAQLKPYRPGLDITGADVYPISYPPGTHTGTANKDISVVGDVTKKMVQAAGPKPVWMTLQIAWSGIVPSQQRPNVVPRFPNLQQQRFMAYQAIVNGARGLNFFGGHLTQVTTPSDAELGWNWTFWERVLRPLVRELSSEVLRPALVGANAKSQVKAALPGVELVTRRSGDELYVVAVRRGGTVSRVTFTGLPKKLAHGVVLFEYVQDPPPPPIAPGHQVFRRVAVQNGTFSDWLGPHDARVYRFTSPA